MIVFGVVCLEAIVVELPVEGPQSPLPLAHFPSVFHAFVFRNWGLVPAEVLADTARCARSAVIEVASAMGLSGESADLRAKAYLSIIRRNWHVVPLTQLAELLGWTTQHFARALMDEDFLYIKLGSSKPDCPPVRAVMRDAVIRAGEDQIRMVISAELSTLKPLTTEPLFGFTTQLSAPPQTPRERTSTPRLSPTLCYGYFADYGDAFLDGAHTAYPDGYLQQLRDCGIDAVWLPAVLRDLVPFPWDQTPDDASQRRLDGLAAFTQRLAALDMRLYLYLNEPRAMPIEFFRDHPDLQGATGPQVAALCSSHPDVEAFLTDAVTTICQAAPKLGGLLTITFSENLTNCWSHQGASVAAGTEADTLDCPRCLTRGLPAVLAGVNNAIAAGIRTAGSAAELIAWDWAWPDSHAEAIIDQLDPTMSLMSVSEWGCEITRGDITTTVGEYTLSVTGPSPRARKHWTQAKQRGMRVLAKIQANTTWEMAAVPYIPLTRTVADHLHALLDAQVDGIMASWTLGGYPSPSLELLHAAAHDPHFDPDTALHAIAERRYGPHDAHQIVAAWTHASHAFAHYPFHLNVVYTAPVNIGPANLLWEHPTGYRASMVGFPYDDLERWRGPYPPDTLATAFTTVATGLAEARHLLPDHHPEGHLLEAVEIHLASTANQIRYLLTRNPEHVEHETTYARRLLHLQWTDSRIGYEASNHYLYTPQDLLEKILNCHQLLDNQPS